MSPFRLFGRPDTAAVPEAPPAEHAAWYGGAPDPPSAYRPPHSGGSAAEGRRKPRRGPRRAAQAGPPARAESASWAAAGTRWAAGSTPWRAAPPRPGAAAGSHRGAPAPPPLGIPATAPWDPPGNAATPWVASLAGPAPDRPPELVDSADGAAHVRDGDVYRRVASGMLLAALEPRYGPRRPATDDELAAWTPGPPVELLEGPKGLPFVVIGSVRIPVRNLPLTHPVRASALDGLPEGPPLDMAEPQRTALAALKAAQAQAAQPPDPRGELKALVFGLIAGVVAAYKGLNPGGGPKGVGDAVNQAVVITFILIFFANFVMTTLYFALVPQKF